MGRASTSRAPSTDRFKKPLLGVAAPSRPARAVNRILIDGDGAFEAVLFFFLVFYGQSLLVFLSSFSFRSRFRFGAPFGFDDHEANQGRRFGGKAEISHRNREKNKNKTKSKKKFGFFSSNTHRGVAPWRVADAARRLC